MDRHRIAVVRGEAMLEVDEPHPGDPKGVLRASDINSSFTVGVGIFRVVVSQPIINKVQAINTEVFERDRTDTRRPAALYIKRGAGVLFIAVLRAEIDQDTAPARPQIVQVRPFIRRGIKANA